MKIILSLILVIFLFSACQQSKSVEIISNSVSIADFQVAIDSGEYKIIDVRTPQETSVEKIVTNAQEIDFYKSDFQENLKSLDKDQKYLIYCRTGNRTGKALKIMKNLGFQEVSDLSGGIVAWKTNNMTLNQ